MELTETFPWHGATVRWSRVGKGPPVVLCHGTPWSSFVWRSTVDTLSKHYSVHVYDMIGYGQSDKPDGDVSLPTQGELLGALISHWGLDSPHVIAHDIGGAVALRAHVLHGVAFRSLMLIDIVALRPWGSPFFKLVAEHADVFAALPANLHKALIREYIAGASSTDLRPDVMDSLVAPWLGDGQPAFYRQIAQADERFTADMEARFATIQPPTLIVWGTQDQWIPVDRAHRLAAMIPTSTVELIDGAGHLVQLDAPQELRRITARWLDQQTGQR